MCSQHLSFCLSPTPRLLLGWFACFSACEASSQRIDCLVFCICLSDPPWAVGYSGCHSDHRMDGGHNLPWSKGGAWLPDRQWRCPSLGIFAPLPCLFLISLGRVPRGAKEEFFPRGKGKGVYRKPQMQRGEQRDVPSKELQNSK